MYLSSQQLIKIKEVSQSSDLNLAMFAKYVLETNERFEKELYGIQMVRDSRLSS